jgi:glycosyltransferase involved in cell wall biosynthesis
LPYLDELWAPSRFIQAALRAAAHAKVPVLHMPHAVQPEPDPSLSRADLGLPEDRFIFASFFDALSMPERKNPLGAVRAFQRAFTPGDRRAFLLVKGNRAHLNLEAWSQLRHQVQGWPNIRLWDQVISRPQVHRLIQLCDAVLSLHRSEGFGLVMAEAMALGRVAVATGWSGNLDFMDESNSALVRYDLVKVGKDIGPYEAWQDWAEPDEEHAAALMRRLVEDPSWAAGLAARGAQTLAGDFSYRAAGERMRRRLLEMGAL